MKRIFTGAKKPTGVSERKMDPTPFHGLSNNVAGGTGDRGDDGPPCAAQTIEQCGLTYVRTADENHRGEPFGRHAAYLTQSQGLVVPPGPGLYGLWPINLYGRVTWRFDSVSDTK